ncbi:MAG TPA: sigma-70 family RNA polymerase sigma factor, partial [Myxococcota bacterium]
MTKADDRGDVEARLAAVWRIESARIVATVARVVGDVGLAEDLASQALVAALEKWRVDGVPHNPGAWLTTTAKHKAIDELRRRQMQQRKHDAVLDTQSAASSLSPDDDAIHGHLDDDDGQQIGDDLLRLIFVSCHPLLPIEQRLALTLRLVAGLSTDEIARAFLVAEPTIAQRIVRAKRALRDADIAFAVPDKNERRARVSSVLEVLYLVFNEGYAASRGDDWLRPELCDEALRLGRVLARLVDDVAEVHGLVALMELQASRHAARTTATGEPILLLDQQRSRWDHRRISRGLASLARAESLPQPGPYTLQAGIAACHARARRASDTDWAQIVAHYDVLLHLTSSPVVALNRAVAVSMAHGPAAALPLVDALCEVPALRHYHLLPSVRGDL